MQESMRKRLRRRETAGPRFITCSCYKRLPLFGRGAIADVFAAALDEVSKEHRLALHAWVVMPEHVHVLCTPEDSGLDDRTGVDLAGPLAALKQRVSQRVLGRWKDLDAPILTWLANGRGGVRFWQPGGGFDRNVRDERELRQTVAYIHRNPVERQLVERADQWRWSSVHWWMGDKLQRPASVYPTSREDWSAWSGFA